MIKILFNQFVYLFYFAFSKFFEHFLNSWIQLKLLFHFQNFLLPDILLPKVYFCWSQVQATRPRNSLSISMACQETEQPEIASIRYDRYCSQSLQGQADQSNIQGPYQIGQGFQATGTSQLENIMAKRIFKG